MSTGHLAAEAAYNDSTKFPVPSLNTPAVMTPRLSDPDPNLQSELESLHHNASKWVETQTSDNHQCRQDENFLTPSTSHLTSFGTSNYIHSSAELRVLAGTTNSASQADIALGVNRQKAVQVQQSSPPARVISNSAASLHASAAANDPLTKSDTRQSINTLSPFTAITRKPSTSSLRKTSPGLAARLKALGFGSAKKNVPPSASSSGHIGRLDEQQLRQLDAKHRPDSAASVVSRRGRPWKGAGAAAAISINPKGVQAAKSAVADQPQQLPEIVALEPLVMDTQKYRLPDHTNGNGTKVTLDTRREHLERSTQPLSPNEIATPPPRPPPKDSPAKQAPTLVTTPPSSDYVPGMGSYFTPGHNRPGSIYTLSRASFADQLAQLTSLQLPDAESLSSKVSAMPTAQYATTALINAAEQIRSWILKAAEVIGGLDSEDDVEWAAAGGREGLTEVENAIGRFEELIKVYVGAIEKLQARSDIATVQASDLQRAVKQMEGIVGQWAKIRKTLQSVRGQVEIAMEWEELWNNVLGDIQGEMDELSRLVFEMEEQRHKNISAATGGDAVDIGDLENIVEDTPPQSSRLQAQNRFSLPVLPVSPGSPGTPSLSLDDSSLLALFARMQPLRASLDFLPMRLSVFDNRASKSFPTACEELDMRREALDASYKKLEKDAEVLRKELGEDRWVIVFRGAGRQAQKMHESVERSLFKLKESIDANTYLANPSLMTKKLEGYEAKKTHYGPAIERVLSIIDKGIKDRLTVNGEILRLHTDLQSRWDSLKDQMREMDGLMDDVHSDRRSQQLRDSVSSMLSNDQSTLGSGRDTPGSSPPSSVIMSTLGFDPQTPTGKGAKPRASNGNNGTRLVGNRSRSTLPTPNLQVPRKTGISRLSTIPSSSTVTPRPASQIQRPGSTLANRPPWNGSSNTNGGDTGHNFKPLSSTTPSPYAKKTTPLGPRSGSSLASSSASKLQSLRSPANRSVSESPRPEETPSRKSHSRLSFRERIAASPGPFAQQNLKPRVAAPSSALNHSSYRRASFQPSASASTIDENERSRPASSLASSSHRSSVLAQPKFRAAKGVPGKAPETKPAKPRWRS